MPAPMTPDDERHCFEYATHHAAASRAPLDTSATFVAPINRDEAAPAPSTTGLPPGAGRTLGGPIAGVSAHSEYTGTILLSSALAAGEGLFRTSATSAGIAPDSGFSVTGEGLIWSPGTIEGTGDSVPSLEQAQGPTPRSVAGHGPGFLGRPSSSSDEDTQGARAAAGERSASGANEPPRG